ncbi:MAG: hypothetical protein K6E76_05285 [Patescibacteria group bacterium]|nr:hypothetical protein [Patescibacteria group bacterium]
MYISTGINQIITKNATPKIITFNEKTEEEMKENLVNILKYRTCSEKDNFDKTVTILCSEIIDPTTKITKENNTYKLEAPHEVYYTPKEMHTISYWINEITPDGAFTITGDYHHYTVSTEEDYEERRKINFENLFSVFHYQREKEQDYEDIKATLQTPEFQGRNFAIP